MEHYELKPTEVVLYKGKISYDEKNENTQLILTNINMVFITKQKPLFKDEIVDVEIIPVVDVKIYEGKPQIKTKGHLVEIYFVGKEKEFYFHSKQELHKFIDESIKLITGKTKAERFAGKIKDGINLTNNTLGVDIIDVTKNAVQNGTSKIINDTVDAVAGGVQKIVGSAVSGVVKKITNKK